jgi:hypothetical protein
MNSSFSELDYITELDLEVKNQKKSKNKTIFLLYEKERNNNIEIREINTKLKLENENLRNQINNYKKQNKYLFGIVGLVLISCLSNYGIKFLKNK